MCFNTIIFVVKEGVSVLRTRFGFTRTTGTSTKAVAGNYYTQFIVLRLQTNTGTSYYQDQSARLPPRLSDDRSCSSENWNTLTPAELRVQREISSRTPPG